MGFLGRVICLWGIFFVVLGWKVEDRLDLERERGEVFRRLQGFREDLLLLEKQWQQKERFALKEIGGVERDREKKRLLEKRGRSLDKGVGSLLNFLKSFLGSFIEGEQREGD